MSPRHRRARAPRAGLRAVVKKVLTGFMDTPRHPLRAALAGSSALIVEERTVDADYVRQFILGWLGGLVFFGTLFA